MGKMAWRELGTPSNGHFEERAIESMVFWKLEYVR
jgi:hypothetical protein